MSKHMATRVVLAVLALWVLAFVLASRLTRPELTNTTSATLATRLLGSSRTAIGEQLYLEADTYFHGGVKHSSATAFSDPFQRLAAVLNPSSEDHCEGAEINEIMPWLRFATEVDPHNIEAYLVAAYWLIRGPDRPDLAEQVLREGQKQNPRAYRIYDDWSKLALHECDAAKAARLVDSALRNWPGLLSVNSQQARLDLLSMLKMRGMLYAYHGDTADALTRFQQANTLAPGQTNCA